MMNVLANSLVCLDKSICIKALRQQVKQETGLAVRRMDAFTLIALLTIFRAKDGLELTSRTGLYSCADYFSSDLMQSMLIDVHDCEAIKPLSFVASVGNAANYYIANAYFINGPNLFIGSDKSGMKKNQLLAKADMENGIIDNAILVVWHEDDKIRQCSVKIVENAGFSSERGKD
ncbi:hypothetical protein AN391_00290 [Pseudoalteromonas sp. P1-13-1a]|nr:hypothetical protein [Pseudoalteromonas sp. P1-13-1a]KPZ60678.1 hypothetical protein AN391_00290 [Pseudoalteromonas sp. P1-13-1a]